MSLDLDNNTASGPRAGASRADRVAAATQWQLMWWKFRRHKLALISLGVVTFFYGVAAFADTLAYARPTESEAYRALIPPQPVHLVENGRFRPHVHRLEGRRDPHTLQKTYQALERDPVAVLLFARGYEYRLFGVIPTDRHLIGVADGKAERYLFLLGTDEQGRDVFSRLVVATRVSLSIGLVGVTLSLILGLLFGGLSGLYGGWVDAIIQRVIEVIRSIPVVPLWMGLAAALPRDWGVVQVYFALTIIISLVGWTELARVVRGRFMTLRQEDFIVAAELMGASRLRIIFRHMVPSFLSHIIAAVSLALPVMIISETALSFLGLGLRAPAISLGVLLQQAQTVQAVALWPWLLAPVVPVIVIILAFNFLGDGLRDAADPYDR